MKVPKTDTKELERTRTQIRSKYEVLLEHLPLQMKCGYKIVFYLLFLFVLILAILSYCSLLGCDLQATRLIQILGALAVAITAIIALSNADPLRKKIIVAINEPCIVINSEIKERTYKQEKLTDRQKEFFKNCSDPLKSHPVQFELVNKTGVGLKAPSVAFLLPSEKQSPVEKKGE